MTGESVVNAVAGFDQNQRPAVNIELNAEGGRKMRAMTRERVGKRMATLLKEKGKYNVLQVATIQSEFGANFQTTGMASPQAAADWVGSVDEPNARLIDATRDRAQVVFRWETD